MRRVFITYLVGALIAAHSLIRYEFSRDHKIGVRSICTDTPRLFEIAVVGSTRGE